MNTMRNRTLWACGLIAGVFAVALVGTVTGDTATSDTEASAQGFLPPLEDVLIDTVSADRLVRVPYTGNHRVYHADGPSGSEGRSVADDGPLVLYSNTLSADTPEVFVFRPGRRSLVADDIVTEAIAECPLTSMRVMVNGGIEVDEGDVFSVRVNLYDSCPSEGGTQVFPVRTNPDRESYITFTNLNAFMEEFPILDLSYELGKKGTCAGDPETECEFYTQQGCDGTGPCVQQFPMIPPTVWLRLRFNTETAGVVVGTPAQRGFSADAYDRWDSPATHSCRAWYNGFPRFPHASFWADMHSTDTEECPIQFLAYMAADPSRPPFIPDGGPQVRLADDLNLTVDTCEVSAYELGIVGNAGPFEMEIDLRWPGVVDVIEGTQNVFIGRGEGSLEVARFEVPPGATLNANDQPIWISWTPNRAATGVPVVPRAQAGNSPNGFAISGAPGQTQEWDYVVLADGRPGIFYASIFCRGEPPLGACCIGEQPDAPDQAPLCFDDLPVVACLNGRWLANKTCAQNLFNPPCGAQACCLPTDSCSNITRNECLAICQSNAPIPCTFDEDCPGPRTCGSYQCHNGADFTGEVCNPGAGDAACGSGETCEMYDLTQQIYQCFDGHAYTEQACDPANDDLDCTGCDPGETCDLFDPGEGIYQCHDAGGFTGQQCENQTCDMVVYCTPKCARWNNRSFCGVNNFACPVFTCYDAVGDCFDPEVEIGCQTDDDCPVGETCIPDWDICTQRVGCSRLGCCNAVCRSEPFCCTVGWDPTCVAKAGTLDDCQFPPGNDECYSPNVNNGAKLVELLIDGAPGVCTEQAASCTGIANANNSFATVRGDDWGFCCNKLGVDRPGAGTIWFKFKAWHTTARIDTCATAGSANQDTLIQVFEPQNPISQEAACASLLPIGCNDDYSGCATPTNSSICVTNLAVGHTYYVLMASSSGIAKANYNLRIKSPCPSTQLPVPNNRCVAALDIIDELTPFSLEDSLFDCPSEPELPGMTNDIWYKYTAECSGTLTIDTCAVENPDDPRPATNLAVYEGWTCPPDTVNYLAWFSEDADFDKYCTINEQACLEDAECVIGCVGGLNHGELCTIDEECAPGICNTNMQAQCVTRPGSDFAQHVASGDPCSEDADCTAAICEDDLSTPCDPAKTDLYCVGGPDAGEQCFMDGDCTSEVCEPQCGWEDEGAEWAWECLSAEECEDATCRSVCAPGSHIVIPVLLPGEQFMIRVGGEFGGEPEGFLSVTCEIDDCQPNALPDLWEIENGYADDCNFNGNPDECDVNPANPGGVEQPSADCDGNGIPDECQIPILADVHCVTVPPQFDCYEGLTFCDPISPPNGLATCDPDVNENGIPDVCDASCPDGTLTFTNPPADMVDAVDARVPPSTYTSFVVEGPPGADTRVSGGCWEVCESSSGGDARIDIQSIVENPDGRYTINLARSIAPGAVATFKYTVDFPLAVTYETSFTVLPGDVDGDLLVEVEDIDALIACLNGPGCDEWQTDVNRSGQTNAQDILILIDLLNGGGVHDVWLGQTAPAAPASCP